MDTKRGGWDLPNPSPLSGEHSTRAAEEREPSVQAARDPWQGSDAERPQTAAQRALGYPTDL